MPPVSVRIPSWADPQNASVLDDWWTRTARTLGGMLGAADPASQAMAIGAPLELPGGQPPIKAFHGSPHDFDQFSLGKIGTGEGGQAYGHGLYFAENPAVAAEYRKMGGIKRFMGDEPYNSQNPQHLAASLLDTFHASPDPKATVIRELKANLADPGFTEQQHDVYRKTVALLEQNAPLPTPSLKPGGASYEVNLHTSPDELLDWDKPLSQQSPKVQQALKKLGFEGDTAEVKMFPTNPQSRTYTTKMEGSNIYSHLVEQLGGRTGHTEGIASQKLKDAGIKGIQYLDQGSRAAGEGTKNFVIFDDKIIEIAKKYGVALPVAASIYKYQQAQQK